MVFVIAVRPFSWGADAETYIQIYDLVNSNVKVNQEITFVIACKLIYNLGLGVRMLFVLYGTITLYLKIKSITSNTIFPYLSFLLYFSCWFVLHDVYQIRVGVAIAFFYFSIPYLRDKRWKEYIIISFVASLFHIQALLMFFLILIPKKKINLYTAIGALAVVFFAYTFYFFQIDVLKICISILSHTGIPRIEQLNYYYDVARSGILDLGKINAFSPIVLTRLFITLFLLFQYKKLNSVKNYPLLIRILVFSFSIRMFAYPIPVLGMRVYEFFTSIDIFVFPLLLTIFKEKKVVMTLLLFYCLFMLFIVLRGSF
ncbi:MAG: EpsG family protein [Treponema sp.]|nr:EpsG family protein [Treponema sp.]